MTPSSVSLGAPMNELVVSGATLRCSMGTAPGTLSVPPANRTRCNNQPVATVRDNIANANILPFGMCQSPSNPQVAAATAAAGGALTPQPCLPMTPAPWSPGASSTNVAGAKALTKSARCNCQWGGVISVDVPGQTATFVGSSSASSSSSSGSEASSEAAARNAATLAPRRQAQQTHAAEERNSEPFNFSVAVHHDMTLPGSEDDKVVLISADDNGASYRQEVPLREGHPQVSHGRQGIIRVLFKNVVPHKSYACYVDLGKDAQGGDAGRAIVFSSTKLTHEHHLESHEQA